MENQLWDTSEVEARHRFDYYRSGLCATFAHLTPSPESDVCAFRASLERWSGANMQVAMMRTSSHGVSRTKKDLHVADDEFLYLNFVVRGELQIEQGDSRTKLQVGDMAIIDNGRPFDVRIESSRGHCHLAMKLQRTQFESVAKFSPSQFAKVPVFPLLQQTFMGIAKASQIGPITLVDSLVRSAYALGDSLVVHKSLSPTQTVESSLSQRAVSTQERVMKSIRKSYRDPEFGLIELARDLQVSERTIQLHLEKLNHNFSDLLRTCRLESAYQELLIRNQTESNVRVQDIAFQNGFKEISAFYKAFTKEFRILPTAVTGK